MIYLVTKAQKLFNSDLYKIINVKQSLELLNSCSKLQYDSETSGKDPHLCKLLCVQFGNDEKDFRIVVDCNTIDINLYKEVLESKLLIGHNLKFDLQFLYNYSIIPRNVYDTMIVEQFLYLGYPSGVIGYSLVSVALRRLGINIDKSVRGEIIWRGLDDTVINYSANDVVWLEKIMQSQIEELRKVDGFIGAKLECDFVPSIAYLEWCGIKLDVNKWADKMKSDKENLIRAENALNDFVINNPLLKQFTYVNLQGSLFDGFDITPKCTINWSSSQQVVKIAKALGFNTITQDKKTGKNKDSVLEKHLSSQKGINDEFLKLYFSYQEYAKVVSSFGQGHLNAINPITGRIHTVYRQLGAASGRLSCGSNQPNTDLAKYKYILPKDCTYPNIQQLPSNHETRSAFIAPKNYKMVSADFSAEESRLAADIYQDKAFLDEFLNGSGDTHSMFAWAVFKEECKKCGCTCVGEVKNKAPQWRKAVKAVELSYADSLR